MSKKYSELSREAKIGGVFGSNEISRGLELAGMENCKTIKADGDLLRVNEVLVHSCLSPPPLQVKTKTYKETTNMKHLPTLK
jgi:hypothetical protein